MRAILTGALLGVLILFFPSVIALAVAVALAALVKALPAALALALAVRTVPRIGRWSR